MISHPEIQRELARQRAADREQQARHERLLQLARRRELPAAIGEARADERRFFLARRLERRRAMRPAADAS